MVMVYDRLGVALHAALERSIMSIRSIALITPGPTWTDGRSVFLQDQAVLQGHLDAMRNLFDRKELLLGGPVLDGRMGIALFDTESLAQAEEHMRADPAVRAGLFTYQLHHHLPYFDAFDGTRRTEAGGGAPTR